MLEEFLNNITFEEQIPGPPGPPGKDGEPGKDYVLTEQDKKEIAKIAAKEVKVPVVEKIIEKTEIFHETPIVTEITKEIKIENPYELTGENVVNSINALEITPELQIDARHIKNLPHYEYHRGVGGGITQVYHDNTLSGNGTQASPLKVIDNGSGSGYQLPLTGVIDGVNTIFTWATEPNVLSVDSGVRTIRKKSADGNDNWTGTTTTILQIAPNSDLFAIA